MFMFVVRSLSLLTTCALRANKHTSTVSAGLSHFNHPQQLALYNPVAAICSEEWGTT